MTQQTSFQVDGPTTGKAWLVGSGRQLDWRHCLMVADSLTLPYLTSGRGGQALTPAQR